MTLILGFFLMGIFGIPWIFWIILFFILSYSSSKVRIPIKQRMPKDLLRFKQLLAQYSEQLVPWNKEEIEKLSLNVEGQKTIRKDGLESIGTFSSIYHEPMFSYGLRMYPARKRGGVLYAQAEQHELYFYILPQEVDVQVNGVVLGKIMDGKLYSTDGSMLANYLENTLEDYTAIIINSKDFGHVLRKGKNNNQVNPRALDLVEPKMNQEEKVIFMVMSIWKIVTENIK